MDEFNKDGNEKISEKEENQDVIKNSKGKVIIGGAIVVSLLAGGAIGSSITSSKMGKEITVANQQVTEYKLDMKSLSKQVGEKNAIISDLEQKVKDADPWFKMEEEEKRKIEEENARVAAERKAKEEAEKKAKEEAAAKKAEEERLAKENAEKNKYNTGITYSQVARNPDDYLLKLGKFSGKVVQVVEGDTHNNLRVAVGGDYDQMLLVEYDPSLLSQRILEDDQVTIYGTNMGIYKYESTMGTKISIPSMLAEKIDIN